MRGNSEQKWRVGWESANKKSSANKHAKSYDSSKSQTLKTAPQPIHGIGYTVILIYTVIYIPYKEILYTYKELCADLYIFDIMTSSSLVR